jgi:hypothetical protein
MKKSVVMMWVSICLCVALGCFEGTAGDNGVDGTNGTNGTNGSTGSTGLPGVDSLVSITDEPAGINCSDGGQKIETGMDTNNNNILDVAEVTNTSYVCVTTAAVYYGNYYISTVSDITALSAYDVIVGDVYIIDTGLSTLNGLGCISTITGSLTITDNAGLTSISGVSNLFHVDSIYIEDNSSLQSAIFNNLTNIENISITGNSMLSSIHFENLKRVNNVHITGTAITDLALPKIVSAVGELHIESTSVMSIVWQDLITAGTINISNNSQIVGIMLTDLVEVENSFIVANNSQMMSISANFFCVLHHGSLIISSNPSYCQYNATNLKNQLIGCGGLNWTTENISGNKACL